jgi:hypothetical protein
VLGGPARVRVVAEIERVRVDLELTEVKEIG